MGYKTFLMWHKDLGFWLDAFRMAPDPAKEWAETPGVVVWQVGDRDWLTLAIYSEFHRASLAALGCKVALD